MILPEHGFRIKINYGKTVLSAYSQTVIGRHPQLERGVGGRKSYKVRTVKPNQSALIAVDPHQCF